MDAGGQVEQSDAKAATMVHEAWLGEATESDSWRRVVALSTCWLKWSRPCG
jgi:hypothetical protein